MRSPRKVIIHNLYSNYPLYNALTNGTEFTGYRDAHGVGILLGLNFNDMSSGVIELAAGENTLGSGIVSYLSGTTPTVTSEADKLECTDLLSENYTTRKKYSAAYSLGYLPNALLIGGPTGNDSGTPPAYKDLVMLMYNTLQTTVDEGICIFSIYPPEMIKSNVYVGKAEQFSRTIDITVISSLWKPLMQGLGILKHEPSGVLTCTYAYDVSAPDAYGVVNVATRHSVEVNGHNVVIKDKTPIYGTLWTAQSYIDAANELDIDLSFYSVLNGDEHQGHMHLFELFESDDHPEKATHILFKRKLDTV